MPGSCSPPRPRRRGALPVALVAVAVAVAGCASGRAGPGHHPTTSTARRPTTYAVGEVTEPWVDHSRTTSAFFSAPALPYRALTTVVLYPATGRPGGPPRAGAAPARADGPFPLLVFAHGTGSDGPQEVPLLAQWAADGFVVAAPTFPLSSDRPGHGDILDVANQPADLSFVLTKVLAASHARTGVLSHLVDPTAVAAAGHSLGAITALAWADNSCCRDRRVKAVVVIDGLALPLAGGTYFSDGHVPLLVVHGTGDLVVGYRNGVALYDEAPSPKWFLTLLGAPHTPFLQSTDDFFPTPRFETVLVRTVADFLRGELEHDAGALARLPDDGRVAGVSTLASSP